MVICVAIKTARDKGYERVAFEMDCKTLVNEMNRNDNNIHKSEAGGTIRKMKRYMKSFKTKSFIHINREKNIYN